MQVSIYYLRNQFLLLQPMRTIRWPSTIHYITHVSGTNRLTMILSHLGHLTLPFDLVLFLLLLTQLPGFSFISVYAVAVIQQICSFSAMVCLAMHGWINFSLFDVHIRMVSKNKVHIAKLLPVTQKYWPCTMAIVRTASFKVSRAFSCTNNKPSFVTLVLWVPRAMPKSDKVIENWASIMN